jgi:hypothetical protein
MGKTVMITHTKHSTVLFFVVMASGSILGTALSCFGNELLLNKSFDQGSNNWRVSSAVAADLFSTPGQAALNVPGYSGNILSQELDMVGVSNAAVHVGLKLTRNDTAAGKTVAAYLQYADYAGVTNRLLLLQPDNSTITNNTELSADVTLPTTARRLVRFEIDKALSGDFDLLEASLDVTPSGTAPYIFLDRPMDGDTFVAGTNLQFWAQVSATDIEVTQVSIRANGKQIGLAERDSLHGEWTFPTGEHMSLMPGIREMVDLGFADDSFYVMDGSYPSTNHFVGTFMTWLEAGTFSGGVTIDFSFTPGGLLNADVVGETPLGNRTLVNGAREPGSFYCHFTWNNVPAGLYGLTAVATCGTGETVSSYPANIQVTGGGTQGEQPTVQAGLIGGGQIKLVWPSAHADFRPKFSTDLGSTSWQTVTGTPQLVNGSWTLTLDIGNGPIFFRLEK